MQLCVFGAVRCNSIIGAVRCRFVLSVRCGAALCFRGGAGLCCRCGAALCFRGGPMQLCIVECRGDPMQLCIVGAARCSSVLSGRPGAALCCRSGPVQLCVVGAVRCGCVVGFARCGTLQQSGDYYRRRCWVRSEFSARSVYRDVCMCTGLTSEAYTAATQWRCWDWMNRSARLLVNIRSGLAQTVHWARDNVGS